MEDLKNAIEREYDLDNSEDKAAYDEMLNEVGGEIKIGNLTFDAADVVETMDPIAYRCGFADYVDNLPERWECPICSEAHEDEDAAKYCCQEEEEEEEEEEE